ncbi:MAG: hypothetical protein P8013_03625 [Candidatus Sulfobium sp.]
MGRLDPLEIIRKYYDPGSAAFPILVEHGRLVAGRSLEIAAKVTHLLPDRVFIEEAAMLHDIGIFMTRAPGIGCDGDKPYVCHGYLGRELLEREGLPRHALVCERHVGVGISIDDIDHFKLPLPRREMMPITVEEKIICFADKFFSKDGGKAGHERPLDEVRRSIGKYGAQHLARFDEMLRTFGP